MPHCTARYVITFDTDWAPQFVMDHVLSSLESSGLPATLFCTSSYDLGHSERFHAALHPNFMVDSTQGQDPRTILDGLQRCYPRAQGVRTHRLYWHSGLYSLFAERGLRYDSSLFLPLQSHLAPSEFLGLTRFPIWWTDALQSLSDTDSTRFAPPGLEEPGLKVLLFHPIHIYCNSRTPRETSRALGGLDLYNCTPADLSRFRNAGPGIADTFAEALHWLSARREKVCTLESLAHAPA